LWRFLNERRCQTSKEGLRPFDRDLSNGGTGRKDDRENVKEVWRTTASLRRVNIVGEVVREGALLQI